MVPQEEMAFVGGMGWEEQHCHESEMETLIRGWADGAGQPEGAMEFLRALLQHSSSLLRSWHSYARLGG